MGIIAIEGIRVQAPHGVYAHERVQGNTFVTDVYLQADTRAAAASDRLEDTLDYQAVYGAVTAVLAGPEVHLLEHLCARIAAEIWLVAGAAIAEMTIRVAKITPHGMPACVRTYVEMKFYRAEGETASYLIKET
ncbi:MAG: dihydroneopterin aldolase [Bacteroidia bacterium]|nr:dihydroneopterin aldolase [Bacteroidia bacterium]